MKFYFAHQNLGCFGVETPWFYADLFREPYWGVYFHVKQSPNRYRLTLSKFWKGFRCQA